MRLILLFTALLSSSFISAQNVGVGVVAPVEKLEVAGNVKASGIVIATGGNTLDFLIKTNAGGTVGHRKAHGAQAIRFIICTSGIYPSTEFSLSGEPFLGEIKMFAGNFPPRGWLFCDGQLLPINQNTALFSLLEFAYGGNGQTTFALPDLRGAAPVSVGTSPGGYIWDRGQKSN